MCAPRGLNILAICLLLGAACAQYETGAPSTWECRMAPGAAHTGCGLPYELANFQGYFPCDNSSLVGRPADVEEVKSLVASFDHIKAVGVGHSWNPDQFCAQVSADSTLGLVMTELVDTLTFIENPVDPSEWGGAAPPPNFPIQVNETAQTVTVAAGIPQRSLLNYLANYTHGEQEAGWTLPAFSWFIDQTIGGAVATGTHGSTMTWGSLSSQATQIKLVLANGTEAVLTPETHPHLWRAAGVSIGRLGVITELTMKIVPQQAVVRDLDNTDIHNFTEQLKKVEIAYNAALESGDEQAIKDALYALDETQVFWFVPDKVVWRTDYSYLDKDPSDVILNIDPSANVAPEVQSLEGAGDDIVFEQAEIDPVGPNLAMPYSTSGWTRFYKLALQNYVTPGTYSRRNAFLSQTEFTTYSANFAPYDQYEVSVPLDQAGTCMEGLIEQIYGPDKLYEGFRTPPLLRFVTAEEFYLSPTNGGPRMYVNMEDYISHSSGKPNEPFQAVISYFRENCGARLHWGKAGWPEHAACFDGAKEYPDTWCHYGCAVQELDPTGKFHPVTDLWQWHAERNGTAVEFGSCCGPNGFSDKCTCAPRPPC